MTTAAGVAALVTVVIVAVPSLRFAYSNSSLHVGLETTEALIGVLLAVLAAGRFRVDRRSADLLLAASFALLAATNLLVGAGPNVALQDRAVGFSTWASAGLRLLGAAGIATAAVFAVRGRTVSSERTTRRVVALGAGALVVLLALALAAETWLGDPIDTTITASASYRPSFIGHPLLLVAQAAGVALFAVAAHRFARSAGNQPGLDRWLATGCVLAAFSRLHYVLFTSLYTSWVSTGDVLRLASYLAFLWGAALEIRTWWEAQTEVTAARERSRIARDLHDGLAQELSFIRSQTAGATTIDGPRARLLRDAAGRALLESRRLIRVLHELPESIDDALRDALATVPRAGAVLDLTVLDANGHADELGPALRSALVGIAREAGTNAVTHGKASHVDVVLAIDDVGGRLSIADDGAGFDPDGQTDRFGLDGMRDRAGEAGGRLEIDSVHGEGTTVTLQW